LIEIVPFGEASARACACGTNADVRVCARAACGGTASAAQAGMNVVCVAVASDAMPRAARSCAETSRRVDFAEDARQGNSGVVMYVCFVVVSMRTRQFKPTRAVSIASMTSSATARALANVPFSCATAAVW
jgi:hypothetical protein